MALTLKQLKATDIIATNTRNEDGTVMTNAQIASEVGISERTLIKWKKIPEFMETVISKSRVFLKQMLPNVYDILGKDAARGSHQHIKLLLDHLDRLEEMNSKAHQGSFTFTWNTSPAVEDDEEEEEK